MMHRRDEIEKFSIFIYMVIVIGSYMNLMIITDVFSEIDIQQVTEDTLYSLFRIICSEVFTCRPVRNEYIIAVLRFAEAIHIHCSYSWYNIDILKNSLINLPEDIDFFPNQ